MSLSIWRRVTLVLALALAALRGILAPGVMFAPAAGGGIQVTICSGYAQGGRLTLRNDGSYHPVEAPASQDDPAQQYGDTTCPFAGTQAPAVAEGPLLFFVALVFAERARHFVGQLFVAVGLGLAAPPPPGHAPPFFH